MTIIAACGVIGGVGRLGNAISFILSVCSLIESNDEITGSCYETIGGEWGVWLLLYALFDRYDWMVVTFSLCVVFIYLVGIPTFILYSAIGMLSSPLSVLVAIKSPENGPDLFTSGPVVQYVDVGRKLWWSMMMTRWRNKNQNQKNISHRSSTFTF